MPRLASAATTSAGAPREAKLTPPGVAADWRRPASRISAGRTDKKGVLRTLVAASSWAATSVGSLASVTERHTTGAPWMAAPYFLMLPHARSTAGSMIRERRLHSVNRCGGDDRDEAATGARLLKRSSMSGHADNGHRTHGGCKARRVNGRPAQPARHRRGGRRTRRPGPESLSRFRDRRQSPAAAGRRYHRGAWHLGPRAGSGGEGFSRRRLRQVVGHPQPGVLVCDVQARGQAGCPGGRGPIHPGQFTVRWRSLLAS